MGFLFPFYFIFLNSPLNLTSTLLDHLCAYTHRPGTQYHAWHPNSRSDQLGNVLGSKKTALPRKQHACLEEKVTMRSVLRLSLHLYSASQLQTSLSYYWEVRDGGGHEKWVGPLLLLLEPDALENSFSFSSHVRSLGSLSREALGLIQDKIKWWCDGCIRPRMRSERRKGRPECKEAQGGV